MYYGTTPPSGHVWDILISNLTFPILTNETSFTHFLPENVHLFNQFTFYKLCIFIYMHILYKHHLKPRTPKFTNYHEIVCCPVRIKTNSNIRYNQAFKTFVIRNWKYR